MEDLEEPKPNTFVCYICNEEFRRPHLLPCLHVFCLLCLQDECQGKSPDKFFCPLCVTANEKDRKSVQARPWHSFERIVEKETEDEQLQTRLAELPAFQEKESWDTVEESDDDSSAGSGDSSREIRRKSDTNNSNKTNPNVLEPPLLFPCTMHPDRLADTFCFKCQQLACHKCVSSFHRRCQQFSELKTAVETKRAEFDEMHAKMASNLVSCNEVETYQSERIKVLEDMRTGVLIDIKTFRTDLVNMILAKEKSLTAQANRLIDQMKSEATAKLSVASKMSESLHKQMEFLDLSISVKGEGELLPLFPGIMSGIENDAKLIDTQYSDEIKEVTFLRDESCNEAVTKSSLGEVNVANAEGDESGSSSDGKGHRGDLDLTLVTSFHGGTRDDVTEPLLTDLILLANGDVIVTDRDNKCVKKFNQCGKLLTRVLIDAVPSRIASVSHGRAVVSVMTKKCLYFLSLFGTVRILNSVPVKKIYSFLTSIGNGLLIAGTNQCDSIDLISERGETLKKIFSQKPDRAIIARPLYLTPVVPHSMISQRLDHHQSSTNKLNMSNTQPAVNTGKTNTPTTTTTASSISKNQPNTTSTSDNGISNGNSNTSGKIQKESSVVNKNDNNNNDNNSSNNNNNPNANISSSLSSNKAVLPQIGKNGKSGGGGGGGGGGGRKGSVMTHIQTSSSSSPAPKASKRRTSLPATQHISSSSSTSPQNVPSSQLLSSSSTSSLLSPSSSSTSSCSTQQQQSSSEIALLVSDSGKRVLFRMEQDGSTTFTLKSNKDDVTLECPLGVTVHECGLTLLSDRDSDCVVLLDESGNVVKNVLTSGDGVNKPCGIYAGNRGTVALTQVDGMIKIYKPIKHNKGH